MTSAEVLDAFRARFPGSIARPPDGAPHATVEPECLRADLEFVRDRLRFDYMVFVTAVDRPVQSRIELVYRLFSYESRTAVVLRALLPRDAPRAESVADLYRTAEWHERETAEMFGVDFVGHPDPRRLLLPDDLEGKPLRKDFSHPNMIRLPEVE